MKKKLVLLIVGAVLLASCNRNGSDNQMGTGTEVDSVECVSASDSVLTFQDLRPVACIGAGIYGGSRPKDVILANPLIIAMSPKESKSDLLWKVISYKVAFDKGDGKHLSHMIVDAPRFPDKVIGAIREASPGTQMIISDIKVRSDVGEFYAPDFTVTIK